MSLGCSGGGELPQLCVGSELCEGRAPSFLCCQGTFGGTQMFVFEGCVRGWVAAGIPAPCGISHKITRMEQHPGQGNPSPAAKWELTAQWKQKCSFSSFVCFVPSQKLLLLDLQEKSWDSETAEYTRAVPRRPRPVPKQILQLSNSAPCLPGLEPVLGLSCLQEQLTISAGYQGDTSRLLWPWI